MAELKLGNLEFEWDDRKAASNIRKHGVSFVEAATAFLDEHAELIDDVDHSDEEDRIILLGMSRRIRVLLVIHVNRGNRFRIVSARLADSDERRNYEDRRFGRR